jgi:hypothetical protein
MIFEHGVAAKSPVAAMYARVVALEHNLKAVTSILIPVGAAMTNNFRLN